MILRGVLEKFSDVAPEEERLADLEAGGGWSVG